MTTRNENPKIEALTVRASTLKLVHPSRESETARTRPITAAPSLSAPQPHYPASYSKDGPAGNYQGL